MGAALLVGRIVLAAVFAVAGAAKLADRSGSRQGLREFGVSDRLAGPLGLVLPVAELVVAVCLLVSAVAWWGALSALALLVLFCVGIAVALARGTRPDCHCFGQLHSSPAGPMMLARNVGLAAVAAFVVVEGRPGVSATRWVALLDGAEAVGLAAGLVIVALVAFQIWFSLQLLHQNGRLLARLETLAEALGVAPSLPDKRRGEPPAAGLAVGSPAPEFELPGLDGERHALESLQRDEIPLLLVFTDPDCGPCTALLPELGTWQTQHSGEVTIVLVSRGDAEHNRAESEHGIVSVLLQTDSEVSDRYGARGTPSAVLVTGDGRIASPVAPGADAIRKLLGETVEARPALRIVPAGGQTGPSPAGAPAIGQPAPDVAVRDLDGNLVSLSDLRGSDHLLLFWNPSCGFCQQMLKELRAWEGHGIGDAPPFVLVSSGGAEANRAQRLTSEIVLDETGDAARAFGAGGTPMAVRIDAAGRVGSPLVAGAAGVFDLARASAVRHAEVDGDGSLV